MEKTTEQKTKKTTQRPVKVCNKFNLGESHLFKHFMEVGEWTKVGFPEKADYAHFAGPSSDAFVVSEDCFVNRIPGVDFISHKTSTFELLNRYKLEVDLGDAYFPESYNLPEDFEKYEQAHTPGKVYISKIDVGSQGYGINLIFKPSEIRMSTYAANKRIMVQRYINNPLLIDGKKNDLRIYVLLAQVDPPICYINTEGLARFCTKDYEQPTKENFRNEAIHLTNYSVNKKYEEFVMTDECIEINNGSKRTLASYWKSVEKEGYDVEGIKTSIHDLAMHTMRAVMPIIRYSSICTYGDKAQPKHFHILGLDVIIDSDQQAHLLEINSNPSLEIDFDSSSYGEIAPKNRPINEVDKFVKKK